THTHTYSARIKQIISLSLPTSTPPLTPLRAHTHTHRELPLHTHTHTHTHICTPKMRIHTNTRTQNIVFIGGPKHCTPMSEYFKIYWRFASVLSGYIISPVLL